MMIVLSSQRLWTDYATDKRFPDPVAVRDIKGCQLAGLILHGAGSRCASPIS
jgi:hypothetical protein